MEVKGNNLKGINISRSKYKIQPKVDQSKMFESVWSAL